MITGDSEAVAASARAKFDQLEAQRREHERKLEWIERQQDAWAAGIEGEETVARLLAELPDGWFVLHDRRKSPRSPANIDHIAIGPTGIHVIDAKNWTGRLWEGDRGVVCGRTPRVKETKAVRELRDVVAQELLTSGYAGPVYGVVALASDEPTAVTVVYDQIAFVPPEELVHGLTSRPTALLPENAYRIWELLDDLHPPRTAPKVAPTRLPLASAPRQLAPATSPAVSRPGHRRQPRKSSRSNLVRPLLTAVVVLVLLAAAPPLLRQLSSSISAAVPGPSSPAVSSPAATPPLNAAATARKQRACDVISAAAAWRLLARQVRKVAVSGQLCEFRRAGVKRPVAIVANGPRVTDATWRSYVESRYGVVSCGTYTPNGHGGGVGACVDPASTLVTDARAWRFDAAFVAAAAR